MNNIIIAPSILSANFSQLGGEVMKLDAAGADWIHIDVMDGHFVPNITIGPVVIKHIRSFTQKPFDVHLMINNPEKYIDAFIDAGANVLTVHYEATAHLHGCIDYIRRAGVSAGVSINPSTPVYLLEDIIYNVDLVLVMSVNPGFGGQTFINHTIKKIEKLRTLIIEAGREIYIEVDGGITKNNVLDIIKAGCNVVVAGSYIFSSKDYKRAIDLLRCQ
jgi:ribulose-phosphate 3-epimerase